MKRLLVTTTALVALTAAPAWSAECRDRLDGLEQALGEETAYSTVLRSGMQDEIGTLWDVAATLEREGDEDSCLQIASAMESLVAKANAPGIVDAETWEREQVDRLESAVALGEFQGRMRIDDLMGASVYTPDNAYLGELDDVVLMPEGRIGYGVVERGGFLDIGDDDIAVPWDRFQVTEDGRTLVLDIDPARLEGAPRYDDDMTEDEDDETVDFDAWRQQVDDFFADLT